MTLSRSSRRFGAAPALGLPAALTMTLALAAALALAALPRTAWANPEALQVLLGGPTAGAPGTPGGGAAGAPPAAGPHAGGGLAPSARQQVPVRRGETLQSVIRRTLRETPYSDAFLRQAFVQLNPAAFVGGSPHRLQAGAVLQVPTAADLRQLADGQQPGAAGSADGPALHASRPEDRKQWVRFP